MMIGPPPRTDYASVVLDVDSTLTGLEGIEWLAARRGPEVAQAVITMTGRAMEGMVSLDAVYGERLALVRPTHRDLAALADAYVAATMPDARVAVAALHAAGIRVVVVSGAVRQAIIPLAASLGIADANVHAVAVNLAVDGTYAGYDLTSPLAHRGGKSIVVRGLGLPRRILAVGDGDTDAELTMHEGRGAAVDTFAAFVGVVARTSVLARADVVVRGFAELPRLALGSSVEMA
jgi:phosphoserine phosphatase